MRVRFDRTWRWRPPGGRVAITFLPSPAPVVVRRCCGERAVAEGAASALPPGRAGDGALRVAGRRRKAFRALEGTA